MGLSYIAGCYFLLLAFGNCRFGSGAILTARLELGETAYSEEQLRNTANELGLDEEAFDSCLRNPAILEELQQNLIRARDNGINEIPVVFINDVKVIGIEPLETYNKIIEEQLAE